MPPDCPHAPATVACCPTRITPNNRLPAILIHIPWYSIAGPARLAADIGVSRSTISRIMKGERLPTATTVKAITKALSDRLGYPISSDEVFTTTGAYPTGSTCELCDCDGCLPDDAYDRRGRLKPEWKEAIPGQWCTYLETPTNSPL